ncbi:ankyrin repeat domain-containing protein [Pedobacter sp. UBA5917]|jgi:ankyrin repeat protein|uniref:ankyrin repeat domain-containing protein n=1 Tax=Pedobacter sp. UBA5917 TaxID=1947061 RepID=UPI0025CC5909|nr:ankyrin repeat domain-containing protein [Pedobacter sp. UBA5917]
MKKLLLTLLTILYISFYASAQTKNDDLYSAIAKNNTEKAIDLLKNGASANYIKSVGPWMKVNMLITAVNNKNVDIVKLLLENKADVNWRDGFNTTALMYAAAKANRTIIDMLLDNGADINANDGKGNTVLSAAKESKNEELIKYIEDRLKEKNK